MADLGAFDNPHLWLASYGIANPYFCWAVAHGALDNVRAPSRSPNKRDVPAWNRSTLRALPRRPRLRDEYVLK